MIPAVPEPRTYFGNPKSLNKLLDIEKLKSTIQESRQPGFLETPPSLYLKVKSMTNEIKSLPSVEERISVAQNAGFQQAQRPNVNFVSDEIKSVSHILQVVRNLDQGCRMGHE